MKFKKIYRCSKCNSEYPKWQGQCTKCGEWNSLVEDVVEKETKKKERKSIVDFSTNVFKIKDIQTTDDNKISTNISEFDRVLSGGVLKGQTILIGGIPGIGKSTLILEAAKGLAQKKLEVLYISGEESPQQIAIRAKRLKIEDEKINIASITNITEIIKNINEINPTVVIVDSIQTIYHPSFPSSTSTPIQISQCTSELVKTAKNKNIILFIVGQVTKEGEFAGPKLLEHMVDTVLYFENDKSGIYRILRTFKNRFGNVDEIGIFEMKEEGLISTQNYSTALIDDTKLAGKTYTVTQEGTRPIIIRVESLVNRSFYPYPKRVFSSIDNNYAQILVAAIEKNTPLKFDTFDIYTNVYSGFKTKDRSIDLAICASIISSIKEISIPLKTAFIGEVGILGQIYPTSFIVKKINELERSDFNTIITSSKLKEKINTPLKIIKIDNLNSLYNLILQLNNKS